MASRATTGLAKAGTFRRNLFRSDKSIGNAIASVGTRFLPRSRRVLLRSILYGIDEERSLLILVGRLGSGKTELFSRVVTELSDSAKVTLLQCQTEGRPINVSESILAAFGVLASQPGRTELVDTLSKLGREHRSSARRMLLLVDDTSNLAEESLKKLLEVIALVNAQDILIQLLLSGEPSLLSTVSSLRRSDDSLPAASVYEVLPFSADEVGEYIACQMRAADEIESNIFSPAVCAKIAKVSGGIPALIDELCEKAWDEARYSSTPVIDFDLIAESALESSSVLENPADRRVPAPPATSDSSNDALVPGKAESMRLREFIARNPAILAGAGAVVLLFLIRAVSGGLSWKSSHPGTHNRQAMQAADRSPVAKPPGIPQLQARAYEPEGRNSTSAATNSTGIAGVNGSPNGWPTRQPEASRADRVVNDEPTKQSMKSILSRRLSEDGARLLSTRNYDDAIKTYQAALASDPKNRELLDAIGRANEAKSAAQKSRTDPNRSAATLSGGNKTSNEPRQRSVEAESRSVVGSSRPADRALEVGRKFLALGHYDEAVSVLQSGLNSDPQNQSLRAELARAHSAQSAEKQVLGSP